ncbi:retrovirus-related pol polyprotein from transposon TNT 1-94 [Tanacetum coccineum]
MKKTLKTELPLRREALRLRSYEDPPESPELRLPAGKKALQSKWVFRVKEEQDGKKRLVLSIVATENLHLEQLDVKTTFLHGDLDEDIYMTQSEGFSVSWERRKPSVQVKEKDTKSSIHLVKNLKFCSWEKLVRILISKGTLYLKKILEAKNPADMLTKVVTTKNLKLCAASTGLRDNL